MTDQGMVTAPVSPVSSEGMLFPMQGARGDGEADSRAASAAHATAAPASERVHNDAASSIDGVEEKVPPRPALTRWQKSKQHFWRFKWFYLIALIVLLAILLPILFKVILPVIVQNVLNGQQLPVKGGAVRALSPREISISLDTSLNTPLPSHLDQTELGLYNKDTTPYTPFTRLNFPAASVNHETDVSVVNQTVSVENEDELIKWFNNVFDLPSTELSVRGDPWVHLGALAYKPSLDLTITIPSLNYLKGFAIDDLKFNLPANAAGHNMEGHVNLPNAGPLTLGLGNLTFNVLVGDVKLGVLNLYDLELKPGNNSVPFDGDFYFDQLIPNLVPILTSQADALASGAIELTATGNSSMVNGEHIKYLEAVLSKKQLKTRIALTTLLLDIFSGMAQSDNASSLTNVIGNVFGNQTLIQGALNHYNSTSGGNNANNGSKRRHKRGTTSHASLMMNMMRLAAKSKA